MTDYTKLLEDFNKFLDMQDGTVYEPRKGANALIRLVVTSGGGVSKVWIDHKEVLAFRDNPEYKVKYCVQRMTPLESMDGTVEVHSLG